MTRIIGARVREPYKLLCLSSKVSQCFIAHSFVFSFFLWFERIPTTTTTTVHEGTCMTTRAGRWSSRSAPCFSLPSAVNVTAVIHAYYCCTSGTRRPPVPCSDGYDTTLVLGFNDARRLLTEQCENTMFFVARPPRCNLCIYRWEADLFALLTMYVDHLISSCAFDNGDANNTPSRRDEVDV